MSIAAIETNYKGFRFRSRLEARWAVVLDALGIAWEYEKEGYIIDGENYLPDFYLPHQSTFLEIKPLPDSNNKYSIYPKKTIYLAGKISNDDWRDCLVKDGKVFGWFNYAGPIFQHKLITHDEDNSFDIYSDCIEGIQKCDIFFAWLNAIDHHATLAEIGYAKALGKEVWLGISHAFDQLVGNDYWFIKKMGLEFYGDIPKEILERLLRFNYLREAHFKYRNLSIQQNKEVLVIYGSPGYSHIVFSHKEYNQGQLMMDEGNLRSYYFSTKDVIYALEVGKRARFEHGEKG